MTSVSERMLRLFPVLLLCGCMLGPDYQRPDSPAARAFHSQAESADDLREGRVQTDWWESFGDPTLTELVRKTAAGNKDIQVAQAAIERARALRTIEGSGLFPAVDVNASAVKQGISRQGSNNFLSERERNLFDAGLDATWELDFWGRVRRGIEAADATLQATEDNRRAVLLSALAEVSSAYMQVRGAQKRLAIAQQNIDLLKEVEGVAQNQFDAGIVSELDVSRTRGQRQAEEALLPALQAEMMSGIYRISTLTGQSPESYVQELQATQPPPMPPDRVPVGLPSELLTRRPDIRRAERELAAATARIGMAKAELFPQFSLTGSLGYGARTFSDLFKPDAIAYSLGALIGWPVFRAGALTAQVEATEAETKAALARYEGTVLAALEDVESSLLRYGKSWQRYKQLKASEETQGEAFRIARLRYESGQEDFLSVLDSQRSLNAIRAETVQAEIDILLNLTQLYKALGGGWEYFETRLPLT